MEFAKWHKHLLATLLFLVASFSQPITVLAATTPAQSTGSSNGFNLTLSPLPVNLVATPGQTVTAPIRIENRGTAPVRIKASIMKFKASADTGKPELVEPTPQDAYIKWASLSQTSFIAQPNVFYTDTMTIKTPRSAAFGYYYAAVFTQDNTDTRTPDQTARVNGAVASLILLDVQAPGEKRQLDVTSLKTNHKLYQYLPAQFQVTVKNTGNVHVIPSGNIFIGRKSSGDFLGTLNINEAQGNVLPNSSRTFTVDWGDGFPNFQQQRQNGQIVSDKDGKPVEKLSWSLANINKIRLGRYVASMTLVYNDGKRDVPVNGQVSFWVIPWLPILIILLVLALVVTGIIVLIRGALRKVKRPARYSQRS